MKREWKILFKIMFVAIVFLSMGIDANASHFLQQCTIERALETEDSQHYISQNSDSVSADQIDQSLIPCYNGEFLCQIILPQINVLFCNYSLSVWQPPRFF